MKPTLLEAYAREVAAYRISAQSKNEEASREHLSRAHILSQRSVALHLKTHFLMLGFGARKFDLKEVLGQVIRITVTVPGHLFGKVPVGNIGWSSVGLTQEMSVPPDIAKILETNH